MNKRTNRNKKNYKLKKRTRRLKKKYKNGGSADEISSAEIVENTTSREIKTKIEKKYEDMRKEYLNDINKQDKIINDIIETKNFAQPITDSLKLLEDEWEKIIEEKKDDMRDKLRERLEARANESKLSPEDIIDIWGSKNINQRILNWADKAKHNIHDTDIEEKIKDIFRLDLQKEKIKLIIDYSHDKTIIERMISKELSSGSMLLYNTIDHIIGENIRDTLTGQIISEGFGNITTSFGTLDVLVVEFIIYGLALAISYYYLKNKKKNYREIIRIIYGVMLFLTLLSIFILFMVNHTTLLYFIIQLSMFLIDVLRFIFVEYGIITSELMWGRDAPNKAYKRVNNKIKNKKIVLLTSPIWASVIVFDNLMKLLIKMIKGGIKLIWTPFDMIINKCKSDPQISVQQGQLGAGKLRDSIGNGVNILKRYMSIPKPIDFKMTDKIRKMLFRLLIRLNDIQIGGYSNKKTKGKYKTKRRKHKTKRRYKTKRK